MKNIFLLTVEELNREFNAKNELFTAKDLKWEKQTLKEWDDTISNVEVATIGSVVYVKYDDGSVIEEDRERFEAGKWSESLLTEAFKDAMEQFKREEKPRVNNKNYITVFRNGDTCRVSREELMVKEVVMVGKEYEMIMMGELENGEILDICGFYPDEIWISESELKGKTLKEAWDVKYQKDRAYLRQ